MNMNTLQIPSPEGPLKQGSDSCY